ncbi:alpha/beta hydrolase [Agromyces atrinae]|uniref:alpha/beta fold hydrolase n=1 Tax=Agromyces atrinae TaxID=592376 RepID=UPI001F59781D|nr:alpha/beta hydrolase [Agromyces atrinae]MCI2956689.1 alpha/beta hydrolase [Agromyces atrinae]
MTSSTTITAPTRVIEVEGARIVYRDVGVGNGVPLVALTHLGANLDSWDPEVIDPLAENRRVILLGYRGVGGSTGTVRDSFEQMAADAIAAIRALGLSRVDLFGQSMGGMVAQAVIAEAPDLVDRVIIASAGPQGGPGLTAMSGVFLRGILRGILTFTNPTTLLFFTRTANGRTAARAYQARLARRREGRDSAATPGVFRAQLRAVKTWGAAPAATPTADAGWMLIVHGDSDRMVPVPNAAVLAALFPAAEVLVYPDSGHGAVSQNRTAFVAAALDLLQR